LYPPTWKSLPRDILAFCYFSSVPNYCIDLSLNSEVRSLSMMIHRVNLEVLYPDAVFEFWPATCCSRIFVSFESRRDGSCRGWVSKLKHLENDSLPKIETCLLTTWLCFSVKFSLPKNSRKTNFRRTFDCINRKHGNNPSLKFASIVSMATILLSRTLNVRSSS
jgi:hypothetical protein